jgi:thiamine biosynthesis lipoprotein
MGVQCTVTVLGDPTSLVAYQCMDRIAEFEQLWSRFIPTSDISRLNLAHGDPVWVETHTTTLVAYMMAAHKDTDGLFNPTLLPVQMDAGDSRSLVDNKVSVLGPQSVACDNMESVIILDDGRVQLLNGATLDAGGMAKGLAADIVADIALSAGATGVCINIGGDMFIHTGSGEAWPVDVMSPLNPEEVLSTAMISHGGIATSAVNARHRNGSNVTHHIFTPHGSSNTRTVGATVIASHAAWAEAYTKFAILSAPETAINELTAKGLAALLVLDDNTTLATANWKEYTE